MGRGGEVGLVASGVCVVLACGREAIGLLCRRVPGGVRLVPADWCLACVCLLSPGGGVVVAFAPPPQRTQKTKRNDARSTNERQREGERGRQTHRAPWDDSLDRPPFVGWRGVGRSCPRLLGSRVGVTRLFCFEPRLRAIGSVTFNGSKEVGDTHTARPAYGEERERRGGGRARASGGSRGHCSFGLGDSEQPAECARHQPPCAPGHARPADKRGWHACQTTERGEGWRVSCSTMAVQLSWIPSSAMARQQAAPESRTHTLTPFPPLM